MKIFFILMKLLLSLAGYRPLTIHESDGAYRRIVDEQPDLVILDTWLEDREKGWNLLQVLVLDERTSRIPVLLCSSDPQLVKARIDGVNSLGGTRLGVLNKPFAAEALLGGISALLSEDGRRPRHLANEEI